MSKTDKTAVWLIFATMVMGLTLKLYVDRMDVNACIDRGNSRNYCISKVAN